MAHHRCGGNIPNAEALALHVLADHIEHEEREADETIENNGGLTRFDKSSTVQTTANDIIH